jgi:hypothetical protein
MGQVLLYVLIEIEFAVATKPDRNAREAVSIGFIDSTDRYCYLSITFFISVPFSKYDVVL